MNQLLWGISRKQYDARLQSGMFWEAYPEATGDYETDTGGKMSSDYSEEREEMYSKQNTVDKPPHYIEHPSGIECIQVTEHFNFCLGNSIKYIWRAGKKDGGNKKQDLEKAIWYLKRELER